MDLPGFWTPLLLFALQFPGTAHLFVRKAVIQVNGILGESVSLPVVPSPTKPVAEIEWKFHLERDLALLVAEFSGGNLSRPNPRDRFGQRLEMADGTTLKIRDLVAEDGGNYTARVRFTTSVVLEYFFWLTVYEPVPMPQIFPQLVSNTPEGCNVTLYCQAPAKAGLDITWKGGGEDSTRVLEESSDGSPLANASMEFHLSWPPSSALGSTTITCLVRNPAEGKNASFDLLSICPKEAARNCVSWVRIAFALGLAVEISAVILLNVLGRGGRRRS